MVEFFKNLVKRLSPKHIKLIKIGGPILAAGICIVVAVVLLNPVTMEVNEDLPDVVEEEIEEEFVENDLVSTAISSGEYKGTVLEKTPDAGVAYVKETLFIGDSNTAGMILNSSTTNVSMNNGIGIVSMGIAHVTNLKCVKFQGMAAVAVPEAVKILQPRRIVITYGTNDYYMKPEKFAEEYNNALDAIQAEYPFSDIIIGSIFPITSNCSYYTVSMPVIEKFNLELVNLAQERGLSFLNWSEALKDPKTGFCKSEYMAGDGVHLSKKGMEEIFDYFRTHKLDSDDKRPKPLKPIPLREATPPGLLGSGPRTPVDVPAPVVENENNNDNDNDNGNGLVAVTVMAGEGGSLVGGNFTVSLPPGSSVSLPGVAADTANGYVFSHWAGSTTVPAGGSHTIVAVFVKGQTGGDPGGGDPGGGDPGGGDPGGGDPGGGDPGGGNPGGGDPGGGDPGGGDPGVGDPGVGDPGGGEPGDT